MVQSAGETVACLSPGVGQLCGRLEQLAVLTFKWSKGLTNHANINGLDFAAIKVKCSDYEKVCTIVVHSKAVPTLRYFICALLKNYY